MHAHGASLNLALALHRTPALRHAVREQALPPDIGLILRLAGASQPLLDDIAAELKQPPAALLEAARFYLQQILFEPGENAYRILGVAPDAPLSLIREHHRYLRRWLHPDRADGDWESPFAARVNWAWQQLRSESDRDAYDIECASRSAQMTLRRDDNMPLPRSRWTTIAVPSAEHRGRWKRLAAVSIGCCGLLLLYLASHQHDLSANLSQSPLGETRDDGYSSFHPLPATSPEPDDAMPSPAPIGISDKAVAVGVSEFAAPPVPGHGEIAATQNATIASVPPARVSSTADHGATMPPESTPTTPYLGNANAVTASRKVVIAAPRQTQAIRKILPPSTTAEASIGPTAAVDIVDQPTRAISTVASMPRASSTKASQPTTIEQRAKPTPPHATATPIPPPNVIIATNAPPAAPMRHATPSDRPVTSAPAEARAELPLHTATPQIAPSILLQRMELARERVRALIDYFQRADTAPSTWRDSPAPFSAPSQRAALRQRIGVRATNHFVLDSPSWQYSEEHIDLDAMYRIQLTSATVESGRFHVQMLWRDDDWLMTRVELEPGE